MNEDVTIQKWLLEHEDAWKNTGEEIVFLIPLDQVPPEVIKSAEVYKQRVDYFRKEHELLYQMGLTGANENWD